MKKLFFLLCLLPVLAVAQSSAIYPIAHSDSTLASASGRSSYPAYTVFFNISDSVFYVLSDFCAADSTLAAAPTMQTKSLVQAITRADISDFAHTHLRADITDFSHTHIKGDITDFAHTHLKTEITDFAHTHLRADITDFAHMHTVADISDFSAQTYTRSQITDFAYTPIIAQFDVADTIVVVMEAAKTYNLASTFSDGTGTISFEKKPSAGSYSAASGSTVFAAGDALRIMVTGITDYFSITIPRTE